MVVWEDGLLTQMDKMVLMVVAEEQVVQQTYHMV